MAEPKKINPFMSIMSRYFSFFVKELFPFTLVYGIILTFAVHYLVSPFVPAFHFTLVKSPIIFAWGIVYYFIKMEMPEIILYCRSYTK